MGHNVCYISLKTTYRPDWFAVTNYDPFIIHNEVSLIPTIGYRGHLGNHFTYEVGAGLGYGYTFDAPGGLRHEAALNLHLRLGYRF